MRPGAACKNCRPSPGRSSPGPHHNTAPVSSGSGSVSPQTCARASWPTWWCSRCTRAPSPSKLLREQPRRILEGLELERIAGRIVEEHRGLLADLAGEADTRLDFEARAGLAEPVRQLMPGLPFQHHA